MKQSSGKVIPFENPFPHTKGESINSFKRTSLNGPPALEKRKKRRDGLLPSYVQAPFVMRYASHGFAQPLNFPSRQNETRGIVRRFAVIHRRFGRLLGGVGVHL